MWNSDNAFEMMTQDYITNIELETKVEVVHHKRLKKLKEWLCGIRKLAFLTVSNTQFSHCLCTLQTAFALGTVGHSLYKALRNIKIPKTLLIESLFQLLSESFSQYFHFLKILLPLELWSLDLLASVTLTVTFAVIIALSFVCSLLSVLCHSALLLLQLKCMKPFKGMRWCPMRC